MLAEKGRLLAKKSAAHFGQEVEVVLRVSAVNFAERRRFANAVSQGAPPYSMPKWGKRSWFRQRRIGPVAASPPINAPIKEVRARHLEQRS